MPAPVWLADEPEIIALLHAALDRFDQQSGEARTRDILLAADQFLPSLQRGDAGADQTWALVQELERSGALSIRRARRGVYDAQWLGARIAFAPDTESTLRDWLSRPATLGPQLEWQQAVRAHAHLFAVDCEILLSRRIAIAGRTPAQILAALATLGSIEQPATLRQLSTFAFWGASKVLDDRRDLLTALFPRLQIRERPIVVAIHLPQAVTGWLFIENQDTYTAATLGQPVAAAHHALIYLAGFRGTATRIRSSDGAQLHFAGPGASSLSAAFERQWFGAEAMLQPQFFWGDLDHSGMQILKALRERFAGVTAWRPGYEPMLADLATLGGLRPEAGTHRQIDPGLTGCGFADEVLLPAIRSRGFRDQEGLAV